MKNIEKLFLFIVGLFVLVAIGIAVGAESFADFFAFISPAGVTYAFAFSPTSLKTKTTMSTSGGGYTEFRFAPKDWFEAIPLPDTDNPGKIVNDFVFKAGKDWIYVYTDDTEFDLNEEPSDNRNSNGYTSTLTGFFPGESTFLREMLNISSENYTTNVYALLDNCKEISTLAFGKGKCCSAMLKFKFVSGKKTPDPKGWEFTLTIEQDGPNCHYEGVGAMNETFSVAADDATPDVSQGTATYLLPENTAANAITALDNAVKGSLITLKWNSTTNHSTIANGATFQLSAAFTPDTGAILVLQATTTSTFAERYRYIPA